LLIIGIADSFMVIRKNISNLTNEELEELREGFKRLYSRLDNQGFNYIAGYHGWPRQLCWHAPQIDAMGRQVAGFLSWHRMYLFHLEYLLQNALQNPNFGLPYWNWRSEQSFNEGIPAAISLETLNNGEINPLSKSHMKFEVRNPQGGVELIDRDTVRPKPDTRRTTLRDISNIMRQSQIDLPDLYNNSDFNQFSEFLRNGYHNGIHSWVGGDMGVVEFAAYDPLFWFHHCNVDRIWAIWQNKNGIDTVPPHLRDVILNPYETTVRDVLNINNLNYQYSSISSI